MRRPGVAGAFFVATAALSYRIHPARGSHFGGNATRKLNGSDA